MVVDRPGNLYLVNVPYAEDPRIEALDFKGPLVLRAGGVSDIGTVIPVEELDDAELLPNDPEDESDSDLEV